jgi:cytochrome b6-f complex iron-sulfur subunit
MGKRKRKKRARKGPGQEAHTKPGTEVERQDTQPAHSQDPGPPVEPEPDATAPAASAPTRRDFLVTTGGLLAGACALGALAGSVRLAVPDFSEGAPRRILLGKPSDFKTNSLTWLRDAGLFVVRDENGFGAFSSRCTHLGCTVRRTAEGFFCPCHGARYGPRGEVVSGPARSPLPWYRLWMEPDGRIWVDTDQETDAATMNLTPSGTRT